MLLVVFCFVFLKLLIDFKFFKYFRCRQTFISSISRCIRSLSAALVACSVNIDWLNVPKGVIWSQRHLPLLVVDAVPLVYLLTAVMLVFLPEHSI